MMTTTMDMTMTPTTTMTTGKRGDGWGEEGGADDAAGAGMVLFC